MSSLKEKSIKGLFWDFSGRIGLQGVGFVVSIVLARLLAPEEFGLLAIITVFINLASVFLDFGFSTALIQKQDVREEHYSAVFYLNIVMGLVLAAIVFLLAPLIGKFYENEVLVNVTRLMALGIFISSFGNVMRARLRREMNFKSMSLASIYAAIISGLLAMFLALKGFGVWSLAIQSVLNQLLANIFLYIFCKLRMSFRFSWPALIELWPFSSHVFFSGLLDSIFHNFDSILIGKLISPTTLGYYYRAKSLEFFTLRYVGSTLASILFPSLSAIKTDEEKFKAIVLKLFNLISFVSFFTCGLLLVCGREIIIILFSEKWEPSVLMFQILIAGSFGSQISSLLITAILSYGGSKDFLLINIVIKSLLFLNFGILIAFNLNSFLIGYTIIQVINLLIQMSILTKYLKFHGLLFFTTAKYFLVYGLSIVLVILGVSVMEINSIGISFLMKIVFFIVVNLSLINIFRLTGLEIAVGEAKFFCKTYIHK